MLAFGDQWEPRWQEVVMGVVDMGRIWREVSVG